MGGETFHSKGKGWQTGLLSMYHGFYHPTLKATQLPDGWWWRDVAANDDGC
jgi:hypothetical protein